MERLVTTSLAAKFAKGDGRKTTWEGATVYSHLRFSINPGDRLQITRLASSKVRAQALKLAADRGELRANGVNAETIAIWSHTAPDVVTIEVIGRRARSINVWNAWSLEGVDSSWLGNAAMTVESEGQIHTISCSDGLGEPTFSDLVVRLDLAG